MKLSLLIPDSDLAQSGVWRDFGPVIDGKQARFLIAWHDNPNYNAKMAKLMRNAQEQMPGKEVPPETVRKLQRKAQVGTVLLDWENIEDDNNQPIVSKDANGNVHQQNGEKLLDASFISNFVNNVATRLEEFKNSEEAANTAATKSGASVEPQVVSRHEASAGDAGVAAAGS